jgi:hypothetical protein
MNIDWDLIIVGFLTVIVVSGIIGIFSQVVLYSKIPSEENCIRIVGYGDEQKHIANELFCEYNESGWHFNKTKFKEALDSGVFT